MTPQERLQIQSEVIIELEDKLEEQKQEYDFLKADYEDILKDRFQDGFKEKNFLNLSLCIIRMIM